MTRPASVDALFAGHTLPRSKAALDEVRGYIKGLERIKEAAIAGVRCERRCEDGHHMPSPHEIDSVWREIRESIRDSGGES